MTVHRRLKAEYPEAKQILYGHSMGSFIARACASRYGTEFDAFIFSATAGKNPLLPFAKLAARAEIRRRGAQQLSPRLNRLVFGPYVMSVKNRRTAFDWLSKDEAVVDAYIADPLCGYLDMRRDGRETWNRYAQEKGAVHDLKDGFKAVSFLSNHELYTAGQLGRYIAETKQAFSKIKAESTAKERRIRDIDALFGAIQTIRELKPIQQEYESIHWNGKREKFKAEHGDELNRLQKAIWLREKLVKSLGLASHLDKEQRIALKTERAQLEAERKALLPKIEEVKAEMAELNRI